MFRVLVEEIDVQPDSSTRRTWFWIDEARLSGPLLRGKMLPYLAVKGRSRGACLVLAFQDIDGFREAAGTRIANEIIAQCSHKALLRMESDESAKWASQVIGQYETLDIMQSKSGGIFGKGGSQSEQAARRDTVLPSEFYLIPATNPQNGLTGYFLSSSFGATRTIVPAAEITAIILTESHTYPTGTSLQAENCQILSSRPSVPTHELQTTLLRDGQTSRSEETQSIMFGARGHVQSDCFSSIKA